MRCGARATTTSDVRKVESKPFVYFNAFLTGVEMQPAPHTPHGQRHTPEVDPARAARPGGGRPARRRGIFGRSFATPLVTWLSPSLSPWLFSSEGPRRAGRAACGCTFSKAYVELDIYYKERQKNDYTLFSITAVRKEPPIDS